MIGGHCQEKIAERARIPEFPECALFGILELNGLATRTKIDADAGRGRFCRGERCRFRAGGGLAAPVAAGHAVAGLGLKAHHIRGDQHGAEHRDR